jgi:UDP-N-acetylmuramyl pentapeptide synthase
MLTLLCKFAAYGFFVDSPDLVRIGQIREQHVIALRSLEGIYEKKKELQGF